MSALTIYPIPAFDDNYIWIVHDGSEAFVVDPGDAAPVMELLTRERLTLKHIFITHHHADHTGGAAKLAEATGASVLASFHSSYRGDFMPLHQGLKQVTVAGQIEVLEVPGHTLDHIALLFKPDKPGPSHLFCGDTLFMGGCGRVFEGSMQQMYDSLMRLSALPGDTWVYCAHEYTLSNLRFASMVEPQNKATAARLALSERQRAQGQPTVPSRLADELATNPFLRCNEIGPIQAATEHSGNKIPPGAEVFGILREWKNGVR